MPELKRNFIKGRMNKDLDERIVVDGEYRDALNIEVATSEGSEVGTVQTILGNINLSNLQAQADVGSSTFIDSGFNYHCVGSIANEKNDKIYWLLAGEGKDIIAEYDYHTKVVNPVVVDIFTPGTIAYNESGRALNFDKAFLVTGINIVDDILFWTDNNTEPKRVNIERGKEGSVNFQTQTQFLIRDPANSVNIINYIPVGPIKHEHLTVIKKGPPTAPVLEMKNTSRGDLDQDGFAGEIAGTITTGSTSPFINHEEGDFWEPTSDGAVDIQFNAPFPDFQNDDYIVLSFYNSEGDEQKIRARIVTGIDHTAGWGGACSINILSGDPTGYNASGTYTVTLEQDIPLF